VFLHLPERPAAEVAYSIANHCACLFGTLFCTVRNLVKSARGQEQQNASGLGESRALMQGVQLGRFAETLPVPT